MQEACRGSPAAEMLVSPLIRQITSDLAPPEPSQFSSENWHSTPLKQCPSGTQSERRVVKKVSQTWRRI